MNRLSGATAAVKHPVEPRLAKNFGMLDAHAGTNCGRPARPRAPGKTAPCRVLGPAVFYGSGFAMVAKLLLLIALLAPILTVAAGVLAHRPKKPDRESREDKNKSRNLPGSPAIVADQLCGEAPSSTVLKAARIRCPASAAARDALPIPKKPCINVGSR